MPAEPAGAAPQGAFFVTGALRSGTTLVEKLLHAHPRLCAASQPLPLLHVALKEAFLARDPPPGTPPPFPLGPLFGAERNAVAGFTRFLATHVVTRAELDRALERQRGTSGFWSPELAPFWNEIEPGPLAAVQRSLGGLLRRIYQRPHAAWCGSKEVFCEEYIPYYLAAGIRVLLVLRDPRDALQSMLLGRGREYAGLPVPLLYALRQWRKSVAFALAHEGQEGFLLLRYEEVAGARRRALARIAAFLGIEPWPAAILDGARGGGELRDQSGRPWRGNSSFDFAGGPPGDLESRVEPPGARLDPETRDYIEALTAPEIRALCLPPASGAPLDDARFLSFREPVAVERKGFAPGFSSDPARLAEERARLDALSRPPGRDELERLFIYDRAFDRLRAPDSPAQPSGSAGAADSRTGKGLLE